MESRKPGSVVVRDAMAGEAASLTTLALAAKASWGYPPRWLEHWRADLTVTPEFVACYPVRVAVEAARIVGFSGLRPGEEEWALEHLWVEPASMRRGLGRILFEDAMALAAIRGARRVAIDAEPLAEPFYLRMGAVKVGEVRGEIDGRPRVRPQLRVDLGCRPGFPAPC